MGRSRFAMKIETYSKFLKGSAIGNSILGVTIGAMGLYAFTLMAPIVSAGASSSALLLALTTVAFPPVFIGISVVLAVVLLVKGFKGLYDNIRTSQAINGYESDLVGNLSSNDQQKAQLSTNELNQVFESPLSNDLTSISSKQVELGFTEKVERSLPSLKERQKMVAEKFGAGIEISIGDRLPSLKERQQMIADKFGAKIEKEIGKAQDKREAEMDLDPMDAPESTMKFGG